MVRPQRASQPHGERGKSSLSEHHRCWRNDETSGVLEPVWPRQPDKEIVVKLALTYLPPDYSANSVDIAISDGAFHKLYLISSGRPSAPRYLMRVAIPVEPFFKTESEVATIEYVREHTSMPIPRVVAYSSGASNPLGFEWILMELIEGVTLSSVWDQMGFSDRLRLTIEFAEYMKQLLKLRFTMYGNIYFADIWNEVGYTPLSSSSSSGPALSEGQAVDRDIGIDGEFVIGRMVSTRFFRDKRALLRADRGPFETARELAVAELKLLEERTRHLSVVPGTAYYSEADEMLARDATEALQVIKELYKTMPLIFSNSNQPEDVPVLWHDDLSRKNILVNPNTYKVTGIVDWEAVSIVPAWEVSGGVPRFLQGIEVSEPPPFGSVPEEEETSLVEIRREWELGLLRRKYTEIVSPLYNTSLVLDALVGRKRELSDSLATFNDTWEMTKYWLEDLLDSTSC